MKLFTKSLCIIFLFLIITSPWFYAFITIPDAFSMREQKIVLPKNEILINEINFLRGEANSKGLSLISRVIINKATIYWADLLKRNFETYEPTYLFFEGEDDIRKTPYAAGPLLFGTFIFFLYGLLSEYKGKKIILSALLIFNLPPSFFEKHYETASRIPFFIIYLLITAIGINTLWKRKKTIAFLFLILLFFEFLRFHHNYKVHYPRALAEQIYQVEK